MIYKKLFVLFVFLLFGFSFAKAEFGEYRYSKYMGIQQQMNNRRAAARLIEARRNSDPTRNIRYPNAYNQYPNIQRTNYNGINAYQRYSPAYYQRAYRNSQ